MMIDDDNYDDDDDDGGSDGGSDIPSTNYVPGHLLSILQVLPLLILPATQ